MERKSGGSRVRSRKSGEKELVLEESEDELEAEELAEAKREAAPDAAALERTLGEGRLAVQKLMQYMNRVLNVELYDFFDENARHFEQDLEELATGRGESLQQYEVFREYEGLVAQKLDAFVEEEGYASVPALFHTVQQACREDKKRAEQHMKTMMAQMQHFQALLAAQVQQRMEGPSEAAEPAEKLSGASSTADAKLTANPLAEPAGRRPSKMAWGEAADADEGDAKAAPKAGKGDAPGAPSAAPPAPFEMPLFVFKPTTLEDLVSSVLNVAKYETFSRLMRTRAVANAFYRRMAKTEEQAPAERDRRRQDLAEAPRPLALVASFDDVRRRVLGLLPQFDVGGLRREVLHVMTDEAFGAAVDGDGCTLLTLLQHIAQKLTYFGGPFSASDTASTVNALRARLGLPEETLTPFQIIFGASRVQRPVTRSTDDKDKEGQAESAASQPRSLDEADALEFCRDLLRFAHTDLDKVEDRTIQLLRMQRSMQQEMLRRMRSDLEDQKRKRLFGLRRGDSKGAEAPPAKQLASK